MHMHVVPVLVHNCSSYICTTSHREACILYIRESSYCPVYYILYSSRDDRKLEYYIRTYTTRAYSTKWLLVTYIIYSSLVYVHIH